ncbi:MAG: tetratricopeptide repeat protein [Planctomycetota bacterium]
MRHACWILVCAVLLGCPNPGLEGKRDFEALDLFHEANALFAAGKYQDAIPLYEKALKTRERMPEAYVRLWQCHKKLGRPSEALFALERGVRVCGRNAVVAVPLAREYARVGRTDEARELYRALLPEHPELRQEMNALPKNR